MFLFAPLWHETERIPSITIGLIAVNLLVFAVAWPTQQSQTSAVTQDEVEITAKKLVNVLLGPESGLKEYDRAVANLEKDKAPFPSDRLRELFKHVQEDKLALSAEGRYRWELVYPLFESYGRSVAKKPGQWTVFDDFGFKPSSWFPGILTHQFLHAGFTHLFFNMLFLWVVGCVLESKLEWSLIWLYLLGGAAAAIAQALWHPSLEPMVGASGAISALMGFALFAMPNAKVKLGYILMITLVPRYGAFDAPLWFFLPLWLFEQTFMLLMTAKSATTNVAYMAHFGGFVFGCLAALASRTKNVV